MKCKQMRMVAVILAAGLLFAGCTATDIVGKIAVKSFKVLLETVPERIADDQANNVWVLYSPAGDQFKWSKDFSGAHPDAAVEFDAAPFINAGLKPEELPPGQYYYDRTANRIVMPYEFGQERFTYSGDPTPLDSFKKIVETQREIIGYHEALDHYGLALGNGNMLEWAKDLTKNDKDLVFVLNPQPFIDAGADPERIEGWIFARVEVRDEQNRREQVDKLLRPFDLAGKLE